MKKAIVVVDMQNDFVDGALGTAEAQAMLPRMVEKLTAARVAGAAPRLSLGTPRAGHLTPPGGKRPPPPPRPPGPAGARIGRNGRPAEGNIAEGKIKAPAGEWCCLKALRGDTYMGRRGGGDARRGRIRLPAADVAFPPHLLRHRREEPPCPAGWFEDIPLGKAEVLQSLIDCLGDIGRCIVGV